MQGCDEPISQVPGRRRDWLLLGLLVLLVVPIRGWVVWNTEVTSRDSIGYIRYALHFEQYSWAEVLNRHQQHPGYSAAVWAVSVPVRWASGTTDAATLQLAAQLTSVLAALLLLVPMYHLGAFFFNRTVGFGGALLFQYLPLSGHHLSDGISEGVFLLLLTSALYQGARAVQGHSTWRFVLCGGFSGLAYLSRPEGLLAAAVTGFVLLALQTRSAWRTPWPRFLQHGAALTIALAAIMTLYVGATGKLTNKPSNTYLFEKLLAPLFRAEEYQQSERPLRISPRSPDEPRGRGEKSADAGALDVQSSAASGPLFAITFQPADRLTPRLGQSARALFLEINQSFYFIGSVPVLLGLWWSLSRLGQRPGFWVPAGYCVLHFGLVMGIALTAFYVSDRHVMIFVLFGCFFAVYGLQEAARRLLAWARPDEEGSRDRVGWSTPSGMALLLTLVLVGVCLPKTAQRLHSNRAGNRAAGEWLKAQVRDGDLVLDDHAWSNFFAGMVFVEGKEPALAADAQPLAYVVVTRSRDHDVDAIRKQDEQKLRDTRGRLVYAWPPDVEMEHARVVVYAQPRDPTTHPWQVQP